MVNSPWLRGMKGYSNCLPPATSLVLTSYTSKSGGKETFGASRSVVLPLPVTVIRSEAASWVSRESRVSEAFILNEPTPPPNEAGAPAGSALTCRVTGCVVTRLRMVW